MSRADELYERGNYGDLARSAFMSDNVLVTLTFSAGSDRWHVEIRRYTRNADGTLDKTAGNQIFDTFMAFRHAAALRCFNGLVGPTLAAEAAGHARGEFSDPDDPD